MVFEKGIYFFLPHKARKLHQNLINTDNPSSKSKNNFTQEVNNNTKRSQIDSKNDLSTLGEILPIMKTYFVPNGTNSEPSETDSVEPSIAIGFR